MKNRYSLFAILWAGFCGGLVSHVLVTPQVLNAESLQAVKTHHVRVLDQKGLVKGDLWAPADSGALFYLNGHDGKVRVQMGSYSGDYTTAEKGQPMLGLHDNQGGLRLLLRLAGKNESPVIIFKDDQHRDRMVMGLSLNDKDQKPFIAAFDKNGKKHLLVGEY